PFKIPYTIKVTGILMPSKEWLLTKGTDGRLMTLLFDHKKGISQNYTFKQFDRGDEIKFEIYPHIRGGSIVNSFDTIGIIVSNEIERQLVSLKGELDVTKASLDYYLSMEKESIIDEAKQQLTYAEVEAEAEQKLFDRQKMLYEKKCIPQEEYEISKSKADLNNINVKIAHAKLQTLQSGTKIEYINYIHSQINKLHNDIKVLERKIADYAIVSPITGIAYHLFAGDTLLIIGDTSEFVINIPVKWGQRHYIKPMQSIILKAKGVDSINNAELIRLNKIVYHINNNQLLIATAILKNNNNDLVQGLPVNCSIECDNVLLNEYLLNFIKSIFN
ncbi:MAG: hypothetical protein K8R58_13440, partial [Bacteroidales bacterium]|nr:hypothetical protein [Bacteroidales bacterium]